MPPSSPKTILWRVRRALANALRDCARNDYLTRAAALSFFFLLSLFPLLIFLVSALAWIPIPNLFDEILATMAVFVPPDAMGVVRDVLNDVLQRNTQLLSLGIVGAVLAASTGFAAMIHALNIAYDVEEGRPYWKKRLVAIALTLLTGVAVVFALLVIAVGPHFGAWLAGLLRIGPVFARAWPYVRWSTITVFIVLAVETIYYLAPNVKQRFLAQIPGAAVAVLTWIGASWGLGWYLSTFANYNRTFGVLGGVLGAVVAFMLWLYITALAILFGAELNSELLHSAGQALLLKQAAAPHMNHHTHPGERRVTAERRLLAVLCQESLNAQVRDQVLRRLKEHRFATPEHEVIFGTLAKLPAGKPESIREALVARLMRQGFPDLDLEPLFSTAAPTENELPVYLDEL